MSWRLLQRMRRWSAAVTAALATAARALGGELSARTPAKRYVARLQATYLAGMVVTWLAMISLSERWLPATLLVYGPRAVVLLPLALLLPAGLAVARRSLLFTVLGAAVAITQIMGFRFSLIADQPPFRTSAPEAARLRLVTLNIAVRPIRLSIEGLIARYEPDVLLLQECIPELAERLAATAEYHLAVHQALCTLSRWPLSDPDSMPRGEFTRVSELGFGGYALAVRYEVKHPERPFHIVNLHLETARKGLQGLLGADGLLPDGGGLPSILGLSRRGDRFRANALIRTRESERASTWALGGTRGLPVFVGGDFNLPVESSIYRRYWRGYANAFERTGRGFGYSKSEGVLLRVRIDHVLLHGDGYSSQGTWLGPDVGSDHRPVLADFVMDAR